MSPTICYSTLSWAESFYANAMCNVGMTGSRCEGEFDVFYFFRYERVVLICITLLFPNSMTEYDHEIYRIVMCI